MRFKWFDIFKKELSVRIPMKKNNYNNTRIVKCALVIGHKQSSQGAFNKTYDIHEFEFNEELAKRIEKKILIIYPTIEIIRIYRRTYSSLPSDINESNPDFVISLHCNAFNEKASGSEVLYYHGSANGNQYANILQEKFVKYLELPNRGIRPKTSEDRGGYLLKNTNAPCLIAEPFFIDNDKDYKIAGVVGYDKLVDAYRYAIIDIASIIQSKKK